MGDGFDDGTFPLAAASHGMLRCAPTGDRFKGTLPLAAASAGNSLQVVIGDGLDEGILPLIVASPCSAWYVCTGEFREGTTFPLLAAISEGNNLLLIIGDVEAFAAATSLGSTRDVVKGEPRVGGGSAGGVR